MPRSPLHRRLALLLLSATAAAVVLFAAPTGGAGALQVSIKLDGREIRSSSSSQPVKLDPHRNVLMAITVTNNSAQPVDVNAARLQGSVAALTFFSYQIALNISVAPGATEVRQVTVNLDGLQKQATGLIGGSVELLDQGNRVLASEPMVTDVRGSAGSVYGLFGLVIALLTAIAILSSLAAVARHKLPKNRFVRAARLGSPALGVGLLLVFTLSAFRVLVPKLTSELPIIVISGLVGFGIGYLTPTPIDDTDFDDDEDDDVGPDQPAEPATTTWRHRAATTEQSMLSR